VKKGFLLLFIFVINIKFSVLGLADIKKSDELRIINMKEYYIHTIARGHTLYSLARIYKVSVAEIITENPKAKNELKVGQVLKIPVNSLNAIDKSKRSTADKNVNTKLTEPLAIKQYDINPITDKNFNSKSMQSQAQDRKVREISEQELAPLNVDEHIVKYGENLFRLALKYGLSVTELKEANPSIFGDRKSVV